MNTPELIKLASVEGFTKENAKALVHMQVHEMMSVLTDLGEDEATKRVLSSIGYYTGYLDHATADKIMDLFETEHPIFGKTHPTPEEALRLGLEYGRRSKERRLI